MDNKLVGVIIAATISLIVVAAVLMPIVNDTVATSDTFRNEGYFTMDEITDGTHTMSWSATDRNNMIIDGVAFDLTKIDVSSYTALIDSKGLIRVIWSSNSGVVELRGYHLTGYFGLVSSDSTASLTVTYTPTSVNMSVVTYGESRTIEVTSLVDVYAINPNGDGEFTMKYSNDTAFVKSDSTIIFAGTTYFSGINDVGIFGKGTINGINTSIVFGSSSPTITNMVINTNPATSHIDLYRLDKITFDLNYTVDSVAKVGHVTYSYFLVPTEVTADRTVPMDSAPAGIIEAIPIIVIVAILALIAGIMIRSRF